MSLDLEAPRTSLWDIEAQLAELVEFRDTCESEDEIKAAETAIAEYIKLEITKVDGIRGYILHCEAKAKEADAFLDIAREEAERQRARREAWLDRSKRLKQVCIGVIKATGKKKLEGRTGSLMVKGNGGKVPLLLEEEPYLSIPMSLCDIVKVPRKEDIRRMLEGNVEVPGATLGERGEHLEVK
jgi:hypothetical protein